MWKGNEGKEEWRETGASGVGSTGFGRSWVRMKGSVEMG